MTLPRRRRGDGGWLCWVALRCSEAWDFIDKRDIDKHALAVYIMWLTYHITLWGMQGYREYIASVATGHTIDATGAAALIGAVMLPWGYVVQAVVKWYFNARE